METQRRQPRVTVTIPDAAALTGLEQSTIRRWLAEGRLTRYGIPRRRTLIDYEELLEFDATNPANPNAAYLARKKQKHANLSRRSAVAS